MRTSPKYQRPDFLQQIDQKFYEQWLRRKAAAHLKRDRKRGNESASGEKYRIAIHDAVVRSDGRDAYTGEMLDWSLISTYDNRESRRVGRAYKARFALLPTVDHCDDGLGPPSFEICSWRTNSVKNDLDMKDLLEVCRMLLRHNGNHQLT